jgi:uncharacterized membrane protein YhaH (DUF805 family)
MKSYNTTRFIAGGIADDTPPFFAMHLKGRLGRTYYIINLMVSMIPALLAALLLPSLMMRDQATPATATGWLLMAVLAPLLLWTAWQYFRCVALRLHDLGLSAVWAGLLVMVFLLSQLTLHKNQALSETAQLSLMVLSSLIPLVLAVYPGRDGDNQFGSPPEPAESWQQTTAFFVVALAVLCLLYQTSTSQLQFVLDQARDGKPLSEQDILVIYQAHQKDVSEHDLTMMIKLEAQESGQTNIDRHAFRQQVQQRLDAALLTEIRTLQYPLPTADLAAAERRLVTESELDQYVRAIAHECGCNTTIREVARRELQRQYDNSLRSKLGLPLPK